MLTEAERNIMLDPTRRRRHDASRSSPPARWSARKRDVRGSATFNRQILGDVSATLNTELEHTDGRSLIGLNPSLLDPLARNNSTATRRMLGGALNGDKSQWRWTVTGNADLDRTHHAHRSRRSRCSRATARTRRRPRATSRQPPTATCSSFRPAMRAPPLTLGGSTVHLDSSRDASWAPARPTRLSRTTGQAAINLDLPISRRGRDFSALGNLTLNANAEVDQLSDFGTLTTIGAGAELLAGRSAELHRQLDSRGRRADDQPAWRSGARHARYAHLRLHHRPDGAGHRDHRRQPEPQGRPAQCREARAATGSRSRKPTCGSAPIMSIRRSTGRSRTSRSRRRSRPRSPTASFAMRLVTASWSASTCGRSISTARARDHAAHRLRFLATAEVAAAVAGGDRPDARAVRLRRARWPRGAQGGGASAAKRRAGGDRRRSRPERAACERAARGRRRRLRRRPRRGRRRLLRRGRQRQPRPAQFSLTDTITFVDKVRIAPGGPELDYLHGDAAGATGGTPRHNVQAQARLFQQWPRRADRRQLAQRNDGQLADRRQPPFLALGDLRPPAVRQSRRHSRSRRQASVAARHAGPASRSTTSSTPGRTFTMPPAACR